MATLADMTASVQLGDASKAAGYWGQAVTHYQAAGQMGATDVGPQIDKASNGATAGWSQQAWDRNGLLAEIPNGDTATSADADMASSYIQQMMQWWNTGNNYVLAGKPADVKVQPLVATGGFGPPPAAAGSFAAPAPAPRPAAMVAPRPAAAVVAAPVAGIVPLASLRKAPAVSLTNVLAATGLGVGGFLLAPALGVAAPVAAIVGAAVGGLGTKFVLKK